MKIKVPFRGGDQRRNGGGVGVEGGGGGAVPPSNLQQVASLCRLPCHHREVCEGEPQKPEFSVAEKELRISLVGIVLCAARQAVGCEKGATAGCVCASVSLLSVTFCPSGASLD